MKKLFALMMVLSLAAIGCEEKKTTQKGTTSPTVKPGDHMTPMGTHSTPTPAGTHSASKPSDTKPSDTKPSDTKPSDKKPSDKKNGPSVPDPKK